MALHPDLQLTLRNVKGLDAGADVSLVGEGPEAMDTALNATTPHLPADKPRYLMGVGQPRDIIAAVAADRAARQAAAAVDSGALLAAGAVPLLHQHTTSAGDDAAAVGASQPADTRPPCAGVGDVDGLVFDVAAK